MRIRSNIAGSLLVTAAAVGVGYLLVSLDHRLTAQAMRLEQHLIRAEQRAARLEPTLRKLEGMAAAPSATQGTGDNLKHKSSAFSPRPQRIRRPANSSPEVGLEFQPSPASGKGIEQPQRFTLDASQDGLALAAVFERESGLSEWGARIAAQIARSYDAEPFFAKFDGVLKTDCREMTCLMTWTVSNDDPNDPELAMAKFELMALAAQKEPAVRRMHSLRRTENGRTVINLYLSR